MNEQRLRNFMTLLYEAGMSPGEIITQGYSLALALAWKEAMDTPPAYTEDVMEAAAALLRSVSIAMNLHVAADLERTGKLAATRYGGLL